MSFVNIEPVVSPALAQAESDAVYRKVTWRLIPLLFLCYVMNYLDRINIGYAQLQMRTDLGFTDAVYGLGASMFYVGYFLFEVPSNLLLERIGARATILRIMFCWGLVSAATMFVRTPTEFYVARFLLGMFEAGFFPGILLYLTFWYPSDRRARIVALFMTATVVSGIVAGPLSGAILHNLDGAYGFKGWQWLYVIEGLPSSVLGIVAYFSLSDRPEEAKWLSSVEQQTIRRDLLTGRADLSSGSTGRLAALRDPSVYVFGFLYFAISCGAYTLGFWLPTMIQALGVTDVRQIGLYSLFPYTFGAIAMVWFGRRSDIRRERRWHFAFAAFVGATGLIATTWTGALWPSLICIAIAAAGMVAAFPVLWGAATARLTTNAAPAGIATITSIGSLAGVVAPFAIGQIKTSTGSPALGLYLIALMIVAAGVVMLRSGAVRPHESRERRPQVR